MTTTDYLQREIRRTELSIRRAERKPNTPPEEMRGLHEKLEHLQEALEAVEEHWQRVHRERGWVAGEPLTVEQLRGMEGKPVLLKYLWTEWCIVGDHWEDEIAGEMIVFTRRHRDTVCLELSEYGKTWTAYKFDQCKPDGSQTGCAYCTGDVDGRPFLDGKDLYISGVCITSCSEDRDLLQIKYCPRCGRILA